MHCRDARPLGQVNKILEANKKVLDIDMHVGL
jgi:hypothetical protein